MECRRFRSSVLRAKKPTCTSGPPISLRISSHKLKRMFSQRSMFLRQSSKSIWLMLSAGSTPFAYQSSTSGDSRSSSSRLVGSERVANQYGHESSFWWPDKRLVDLQASSPCSSHSHTLNLHSRIQSLRLLVLLLCYLECFLGID